jgi:hypothetical protein
MQNETNEITDALVPVETELIIVKQIPVIEERLRSVKSQVESRVESALALAVSADSIQQAKEIRAELRKEFQQMEERRKAVKVQVLAPYNKFEATYKDCISETYQRADAELKKIVDDGERTIKQRCEEGLREYFAELCEANHLDFLRYEQAGVTVDMTSAKAKTPTKLRTALREFVADVARSVDLIATMDASAEIMVEYKQSLNLGTAVATVQDRRRRLDAEKAAAAQREEVMAQEAEVVRNVQSFAPPVEVEQPKMASVTFTVTDTVDRLKLLKQFLVSNGYKYE